MIHKSSSNAVYRKIILFALSISLIGCASVQPVLAPSEAADPSSGYVAGLFTRMKSRNFAFIISSVDGKSEYVMSLGENSSLPTAVKDQTVAVKLPPGVYTVSQWITYATLTKEIMSRKKMDNPILSRPFSVQAGTVVHLGSYDISESWEGTGMYLKIQPLRRTEGEVKKSFMETYPNLKERPFRCLLCIDTVGLH